MRRINIKKTVSVIFASLVIFASYAGEYKVVKEHELSSGTFTEYRLKNNIPVYINTEVPNQVDAVYLIVKGGTMCLKPNQSGLESSLFEMMTFGSEKYSYEMIQTMEYLYQSSIGHYSLYSGSVYTLSCINYYLDQMLPVFLDGFMRPSFNEKQFSLMKEQQLQNITSSKNDPQSILFAAIHKQLYKNSPLLTSSSVKEESYKNITIENMKKHHKKILDASRIQIVAVGKFDPDSFLKQLDETVGTLNSSKFKEIAQVEKKLNIGNQKIVMNHKDAKGSEMAVRVFQSPSVLSEDYVAGQIVSDIFSTTMFNIIREKYGACYTPASQIDSSFNPVGIDYGMKVSDMENFEKYFEECVQLMLDGKVISSVNAEEVVYDTIENVLEGYKNSYITKKYTSQSTSSGIASRVSASILQFGDLTTADKIPGRALKVTSDDVLRVFKKYWVDSKSQWFIMKGEN